MKRVISFFLAMTLILGCCSFAALADDTAKDIPDGTDPAKFSYLNSVGALIDKKALGFVICASKFTMIQSGYLVTLTCTLQRTDGSSGWLTYKSESQTFASGSADSVEKTWFAPAGYTYRTLTRAVVRDSTSTVVEVATVASSLIYK